MNAMNAGRMKDRKGFKLLIGIDVGRNTGYAEWYRATKELKNLKTYKVHQALKRVEEMHEKYGDKLLVRFEDSRQRRWFGANANDKVQGAGAVKRECTIWQEFLEDYNIAFEAVAPKNTITKIDAHWFKTITKYKKRTSEHSRDAGFLVFDK